MLFVEFQKEDQLMRAFFKGLIDLLRLIKI